MMYKLYIYLYYLAMEMATLACLTREKILLGIAQLIKYDIDYSAASSSGIQTAISISGASSLAIISQCIPSPQSCGNPLFSQACGTASQRSVGFSTSFSRDSLAHSLTTKITNDYRQIFFIFQKIKGREKSFQSNLLAMWSLDRRFLSSKPLFQIAQNI